MDFFKRQKFSKEELRLFFMAFKKNLFTRPQKGEIFSSVSWNNPNGMSLLFTFAYYDVLVEEMKDAKISGKFASSNVEGAWDNLLDKLLDAEMDFGSMSEDSDYYVKCSPFWD